MTMNEGGRVKKRFISVMAIGMSLLAAGCAVSEPQEIEARDEQEVSAPANAAAPEPSILVDYCEDLNGTSCVSGTTTCFLRYDAMWSSCSCVSRRWICKL